ncbi:MAG: 3-phosphoserine/phosphohydroxythreonine transaminase [Bacillota bacterium]|nr:3-phosphoserine/phosphohydroxythreonine transaminase [Bacillota bacterium]
MNRVYNFSAGPSVLPEEVMKIAQSEMLCYGTSGMSVMEMSHRSKDFEAIIGSAEELLRELMGIPSNYKVLFLQGGASMQFAAIPMNLMTKYGKAQFINTGMWSKKAIAEAKRFGIADVVATSEDKNFSYVPKVPASAFSQDVDYVYTCANNTIFGTRYNYVPETGNVPLVSDMSSCILSEPVDVSKYGLIFAGAQKNMGPAGLTVVIVREDLIGKEMEKTPTMLKYSTQAENGSMYNTPPTYAVYICKLVLEWLKAKGGLTAMQKINEEKAAILYKFLEESKMFNSTTVKEDRSLMNIPFVTGNDDLDKLFVKEATAAGFVNIKGHRSVGGMRASIYNAMPVEGVSKLVEFMKEFEVKNK